jgi:uncharacterized RmlC-like cupin family protein
MIKHCVMSAAFVIMLIIMCFTAYGQDQPTLPSFYELSEYRFRYPETDTNIDMYIRSWRDSHQHVGHGGFLERAIFTPGDPAKPSGVGEVLKYLKEYDHGVLNPGSKTRATTHEREQVIFYVTGGGAEVTAGGVTAGISEGSYVFVPAGLEYEFVNTSDEYLDVVIASEEISEGFRPSGKMAVGNYRESVPDNGWQWAYDYYEIAGDAAFENPVTCAVVTIDAFDISHPYVQREGTEELWYQIEGDSLMLLGTHLRKQDAGVACYVPPNGKIPHGNINPTQKPMKWLYICNRHGK